MKPVTVTPSSDWPISARIMLTDAYLQNPIEVKVRSHPNADHLVCEDDRGVVYYARTDRVAGFVNIDFVKPTLSASALDEFADILG